MNKEDKKIQKQLIEEMMKVSETNPDVMIYMQTLMENYEKLENIINKQKEVLDKIKEYTKEDMYGEPKELYGLVDGEHILKLLEEIE